MHLFSKEAILIWSIAIDLLYFRFPTSQWRNLALHWNNLFFIIVKCACVCVLFSLCFQFGIYISFSVCLASNIKCNYLLKRILFLQSSLNFLKRLLKMILLLHHIFHQFCDIIYLWYMIFWSYLYSHVTRSWYLLYLLCT